MMLKFIINSFFKPWTATGELSPTHILQRQSISCITVDSCKSVDILLIKASVPLSNNFSPAQWSVIKYLHIYQTDIMLINNNDNDYL
jgi:hypothetical protein